MLKRKLLLLLILLSSLAGYSQTVTPQWKAGTGYILNFYPGKSPAGYDTLAYVTYLRGLFKLKADTINSNGYATIYRLNKFVPTAAKAYSDSLHSQIFTGNNTYSGSPTFTNGISTGGSSSLNNVSVAGTTNFHDNIQLDAAKSIRFSSAYTAGNDVFLYHGDELNFANDPWLTLQVKGAGYKFYKDSLIRISDSKKALFQGDAITATDTSTLARKLLRYGETITTPPTGYGRLSLNANGSFVVNKASGNNRTWASTYPGSVTMTAPYKASSILADSTNVANAITFGSPIYTQSNIRVAAWGDSMTRGTGSPNAPYTNTFLYYLGLLSNYTFYNGGVNGQTSAQIGVRVLADTAKHAWKTLIWEGRNDVTGSVPTATTKSNIAAQIASLGHKNYIVIGVLYKQSEIIGTPARDTVTSLNTALSTIYAGHYFDPNPALIAAYNPSLPQDVTDHTNGVYPTSLGAGDGTHLNSAGQLVNATELYKYFRYLYTDRKYISSENIAAALDRPTPIGNSMPNSGAFTTLSASDTVTNNTQNQTSLVNINRSGSFINGGQVFNYAANINNSSTLASGGGSIYNIGLLVNTSNGVTGAGNIAGWFQTGSLILGSLTSGFANNKLDVQGLSRFGVVGAVNGDMSVANKITLGQGTGGTSNLIVTASGASGTAFSDIGNTGASGVTWRVRVGGNTANSLAGLGVNEGNYGLYDLTNSKLAFHIQKSTTNIGLHSVFNATAQLQFAPSTATTVPEAIKFGVNSVLPTALGAATLQGTNIGLFYVDTISTVRTRREILLDTKVQSVRNKVNDPTNTFQSATGGTTDSLTFSNTQKLVKKIITPGIGMSAAQTATSYTPAVDTTVIKSKASALADYNNLKTSIAVVKYLRLTGSGTGAATTISIAHGQTGITSASIATIQAINAASAGVQYITCDATNINIVYSTAPVSGTNNLSYNLIIKP